MSKNLILWIFVAIATFQSIVITISAQNNAQCSWGLFKCEGETKCIPSTGLCDSISDCTLGDDEREINCLNSIAPPLWIQDVNQTSPYATRAYIDDHVAVYFDRNVDRTTTTWLFPVMSYAWAYVKDLYGDFGPNPLLNVILREEEFPSGQPCINYLYTDPNSKFHKNIINCNDLEENPDGSTQARNPWSMANSLNLEKLLTNLEDIVGKGIFLSTTPQIQNKIFQNYMRDLFLYDLYRSLQKQFPELSQLAFNKKTGETFFQQLTPYIYYNYGEASVLKNIFGAIKWYGPRLRDQGYNHIDNGLLLHFINQLIGNDFEPSYIYFFRNTSEIQWQLARARRTFPFTNFVVPYADQEIEVYLRPYQFYPKSTYHTVSEAWKYFKDQYGPFLTTTSGSGNSSKNHEIYFNRENTFNSKGCKISNVIEYNYYNKTTTNNKELESDVLKIIDCRAFGKSKNMDKTEFLETILVEMGNIALQCNSSWPGYQVSKLTINSILVYDAYLHTDKSNKSVVNWEIKQNAETSSFPRVGTFWFRDWYQKIYLAHGKSAVLKRFLAEVKRYGMRENGTRQFNMGEFVHLWSGAAGANLEHVARAAFGWNETYHGQFIEARVSLPGLKYPVRPLKIAFKDHHVKFHYKNSNFSASKLQPISAAWKYFKETYSPFGNESSLQILLYNESLTPADEPCLAPGSSNSTADLDSVVLNEPGILNIVDCSPYDSLKFETDTNSFLDFIVMNMVEISLTEWPGRELSGDTMSSILVYDIYSAVDLIFHKDRWSEGKAVEAQSFPREGTLWFQNWYLSIYQRHRTLPVLKNVLFALNQNNVEHQQVNMGEWVHFWSGAAQVDLRDVAEIAFGWNETYWFQLEDARKNFPKFNYTWEPRKADSNPGNPLGTIIGILVSFLVCLVAFLSAFRIYQRRLRLKRRELTPEEVDAFLTGVNRNGTDDAHASVDAMRFNNRYELPKEKLAVDRYKVLGSGAFGIVLHGVIKGDPTNDTRDQVVAVKTVQHNVETSVFMALLSEIKIMAHLGPHNHIVTLLGTVTSNIKNREVYAALEFCAHGDLLRYLRKHRETFQDLWKDQRAKKVLFTKSQENGEHAATAIIDPTFVPPSPPSPARFTISTLDLIKWSSQIASGMAYLALKNVIHGDLATRNVLLTSSNVAKISDFGLSRQLMNLAVYKKKSSTPIPWKWLALESLCENIFSLQSDIWSYGVTLWEIFTLGKVPYPGKFWDGNFVNNLVAGDRMEAPEFGNDSIYALMLDCWKKEPMDRVSFIELHFKLEEILGDIPSHLNSLEDDEIIYASV